MALTLVARAVRAQSPPAPDIQVLAMQGDPAPGSPPANYSSLLTPHIDGAGNVLFAAFLDGPGITEANDMAIFYGPPGNLERIIAEGEQCRTCPLG